MCTMTVSKYVGEGEGRGRGTRGDPFQIGHFQIWDVGKGGEGRLTIGYICYRWCEGSLYKKNGTQA
jgi:hypothetical protein